MSTPFFGFFDKFREGFLGKVHVGDLLCDGHKLWYRVGRGPGMPGPYRVVEGEVSGISEVRGWHVCRPYR